MPRICSASAVVTAAKGRDQVLWSTDQHIIKAQIKAHESRMAVPLSKDQTCLSKSEAVRSSFLNL